jgi:hypothetical protein
MISEVTIQKHARDGKVIIATFVARSYQENVNLLRIELEDAYSCKVLLITHSDIFAVLPKYRHALGG